MPPVEFGGLGLQLRGQYARLSLVPQGAPRTRGGAKARRMAANLQERSEWADPCRQVKSCRWCSVHPLLSTGAELTTVALSEFRLAWIGP